VAAILGWREDLRPHLRRTVAELERLAVAHRRTVALGRSHFMDAVPTTYGRVFEAWAWRVQEALRSADAVAERLQQLPLGGTAVGSGIGSRPEVVARVVALLDRATGIAVTTLAQPAAGIAGQDAPIGFADALAGVGRVLFAVANDVRLRGSGPFGGLGELIVPPVQPGSSIMPGKVNPVIAEAVAQAAVEVEGLASACRASAALHQLDLSHANPLLAWNLDAMTRLLGGACSAFADRCLSGLEVNVARARELAARSPAVATALASRIGYERAAEVAKAAEQAKETVGVAAARLGVLGAEELERLLALDELAGIPAE
jgi:fumarate hydratase class II